MLLPDPARNAKFCVDPTYKTRPNMKGPSEIGEGLPAVSINTRNVVASEVPARGSVPAMPKSWIPLPLLLVALAACGSDTTPTATTTPTTPTTPGTSFKSNPCPGGTVQLGIAQSTRVDCSAGGTTVTLVGNGASYIIVPEFATDQVANTFVKYSIASGTTASASISPNFARASRPSISASMIAASGGVLPPRRLMASQLAAERFLRARTAQRVNSGTLKASLMRAPSAPRSAQLITVPPVGSTRSFHVASSFTTNSWKTVGATLAYVGSNVLLYIDTLAPANGFTGQQLNDFGKLFDQTLYPIDTTAFGSPVDLDQNGRVIMLMSPVVNGDTPTSTCNTSGYVAGFFDTEDFNGPTDPNSNQGEVFYSIVPDPNGTVSCSHSVADLGLNVPATFLHELQHLIYFSQHVIVSNSGEGSSWMDEGLSIIAEELGSLYYEQKCPPPACRTSPAQLFPDSAQGFVSGFLYDSYQYAYLPDTASLTLHDDSEDGFSWRGGDWLLMRYLGDQVGTGFFKKLERGPANGITNIQQASGQSFASLFANFGIALATDSLAGLPRNTAPAANRFTTRNVKALWARLFVTSGGSSSVPVANPILLYPITSDTSSSAMYPGTLTYYRLDTPASAATVTIQFSAPGGAAFLPALKSQLGIFRLPAGQ